MPNPAYAELHCISNFTFLRGASHPEELLARAAELGYEALAVTDECSLAGVVRAHEAAKEHGIRLLVGSELHLEDGPNLVLLAMDKEGYGNLSQLITRARRGAAKGGYRIQRKDLESGAADHCLALLLPPSAPSAADARWLRGVFPERAWLAVELLGGADDRGRLAALTQFGKHTGLPLVATGDVHMHLRSRQPLQDTLTAIRLGKTVAAAGPALHPNAERHLREPYRLRRIYPPPLLQQTLAVARRCRFSLDELQYRYPVDAVPADRTPTTWLRHLTEQGMARRWPRGAPEKVRGLIEHELALIAELGYEPYFLTVYDLVRFARSRGILCQGRGSAANSAVCYVLGITEVDPARMEMLFERFVSKERDEPPDIDVDFEHQRREEVIQYIYGKYGRERAALTATVIRYRPRSAVRDLGKALGLETEQIDRLAASMAWWEQADSTARRLRELGLDPASRVVHHLLGLLPTLIGFPRHLSQHVGGFVITRGPISRLVPMENAAMAARTVIQWDKDDLDSLGILKVDVLALGMLSAIHRCLDLVGAFRGRPLAPADIPAEDPAVYAMLRRADTVGVFQIESRAQMAMLPRLAPRTFYDLVVEVALVRPGPIQGQMVHPYLRRRRGLEAVTYPGPEVRAVLERTLGVPIFQEQVIKLAMVAAGFSPGEADRLRRAIGSWRKEGELRQFEDRLLEGMARQGYQRGFAEQLVEQIRGFGGYGFPESHAAGFALIAYCSAWLKLHHPAAYLAALLNSQPMGFYAPSQLVQDARRHGVEVRPADAAASHWEATLETGAEGRPAVRLGLNQLKDLSRDGARRLVAARQAAGPFADVADLARRARLPAKDLHALADGGALSSLAGHRREARWQALASAVPGAAAAKSAAAEGGDRGAGLLDRAPILEAPADLQPPSEGMDLVDDYAHLGLTLGRHPLALLRPRLQRLGLCTSARVRRLGNNRYARTAGLVTARQRPSSASGVVFVTLEDETGSTNVVVRESLLRRQRGVLLNARLLGVAGSVERDGPVVHLVALRLEDHTPLLGRLPTRSRDFR